MRTPAAQSNLSKLAWFVGLWLAGLGTVGLVSLAIRAWLR